MTQEVKPSELLFKVVANEIGWLTDIQASNGEIVFTANGELTEAEAGAVFLCKTLNNFYPLLEACKNLLKLIEYETDLPYSAANGNLSPNGILDEGVVMTKNLINRAIKAVKNAEAQGARDE